MTHPPSSGTPLRQVWFAATFCLGLLGAVPAGAASALAAAPATAAPPADVTGAVAQEAGPPREADRPPASVSFDEALGLAARAPGVAGAEAAAAEQRRIGESVSSFTDSELQVDDMTTIVIKSTDETSSPADLSLAD